MSRYRGLIVLLVDVAMIFCCNFAVFLPELPSGNIRFFNLVMHIGLLTVCVLIFQLALRTYNTLWRYAESREYLTLLSGMGLGFALYAVVNLLMGMSTIYIDEAPSGLVRLQSKRTSISVLCTWSLHRSFWQEAHTIAAPIIAVNATRLISNLLSVQVRCATRATPRHE